MAWFKNLRDKTEENGKYSNIKPKLSKSCLFTQFINISSHKLNEMIQQC